MALADVFVPAIPPVLSTNEESRWVAPPPPPPSPEPQIREFEDEGLDCCRLPPPLDHHLYTQDKAPCSRSLCLDNVSYPQYSAHYQQPFSTLSSPLSSSPHAASCGDIPPVTSAIESSLHSGGSSSVENSLVLSYPSASSSSSTNLDLLSSGYEESCEGRSFDVPPQQRKRKVSMKRKNTSDFGGMDSGLEASQESSAGGGGGDTDWVVIDVQPSHPAALKKVCPEAPPLANNLFHHHRLLSLSSHPMRDSAHLDTLVSSSAALCHRVTDETMQMECEYRTESMDPATSMDVDDVLRTVPNAVAASSHPFCNYVPPHLGGWQHAGGGMRSLLLPQRDQPRCHSSGEMYATGGGPPINSFLYNEHMTCSSISNMFQAHFSKSL